MIVHVYMVIYFIQVHYVDSGAVDTVAMEKLYDLPSHLKVIPYQVGIYICLIKDQIWLLWRSCMTFHLISRSYTIPGQYLYMTYRGQDTVAMEKLYDLPSHLKVIPYQVSIYIWLIRDQIRLLWRRCMTFRLISRSFHTRLVFIYDLSGTRYGCYGEAVRPSISSQGHTITVQYLHITYRGPDTVAMEKLYDLPSHLKVIPYQVGIYIWLIGDQIRLLWRRCTTFHLISRSYHTRSVFIYDLSRTRYCYGETVWSFILSLFHSLQLSLKIGFALCMKC